MYIQPSVDTFQSQLDENTEAKKLMSAGHSTGLLMPIAFDSGSQNTLKP